MSHHTPLFSVLGVDVSSIHTMKMQRRSTMMSDVRQLVATGEGLSQSNEDGVTLVKMVKKNVMFFALSSCYLLYYPEATHSLCWWVQRGGVYAAGERG